MHAQRASHHQSTAEVTVESRLTYLEQSLEDRHGSAALPHHSNSYAILGSVGLAVAKNPGSRTGQNLEELSYGHGKLESLHGRLGHLEAGKPVVVTCWKRL